MAIRPRVIFFSRRVFSMRDVFWREIALEKRSGRLHARWARPERSGKGGKLTRQDHTTLMRFGCVWGENDIYKVDTSQHVQAE